ncbi:Rhodanese-like domain-containing protein 8, chloroplastic [Dirofilaria immitis]
MSENRNAKDMKRENNARIMQKNTYFTVQTIPMSQQNNVNSKARSDNIVSESGNENDLACNVNTQFCFALQSSKKEIRKRPQDTCFKNLHRAMISDS